MIYCRKSIPNLTLFHPQFLNISLLISNLLLFLLISSNSDNLQIEPAACGVCDSLVSVLRVCLKSNIFNLSSELKLFSFCFIIIEAILSPIDVSRFLFCFVIGNVTS